MKDAKLNNLLGIEQYSESDFTKKAKTTKRTEVAKDVLQENAYVVGKNVLGERLPNKEDHIKAGKGLNNLISLSDFTKAVPSTSSKSTKRTSVAKDVLLEKKGKKDEECDDDDYKMKKGKKGKKDEECEDEPKKGLTAKQKKLPEAFQKAILKKQNKK